MGTAGTATHSPPLWPRKKALGRKRIGWLYPIFRDLHFYHGPTHFNGARPDDSKRSIIRWGNAMNNVFAAAGGSLCKSSTSRRYAALSGHTAGQRRHLGWLRVRCGYDNRRSRFRVLTVSAFEVRSLPRGPSVLLTLAVQHERRPVAHGSAVVSARLAAVGSLSDGMTGQCINVPSIFFTPSPSRF